MSTSRRMLSSPCSSSRRLRKRSESICRRRYGLIEAPEGAVLAFNLPQLRHDALGGIGLVRLDQQIEQVQAQVQIGAVALGQARVDVDGLLPLVKAEPGGGEL